MGLFAFMIIDIGAWDHVFGDIALFHTLTDEGELEVELANGSTVKSKHKGEVRTDTEIVTVTINTVYFIYKLQLSLLWGSRLHECWIATVISKPRCILIDREHNNDCIWNISCKKSDELHNFSIVRTPDRPRTKINSVSISITETEDQTIINLWHSRWAMPMKSQ